MGNECSHGHDCHGDDHCSHGHPCGSPQGHGSGVCHNFPWLPWCPDPPDPPTPPSDCTPGECPPDPCEGPSCLPDPYNPFNPDECTRTCEPLGSGEDLVWKCSYTCGTPQVNAFLGWADTRIAELQAWAGPLVDQFFGSIANFEGMGQYALENLDTMKDLFRDMIDQFTNLQNLEGIREALQNINLKIPTLEQFQEMMQELLGDITIHLSPPDPNIEPCSDILKPQCWANIWQNMLQTIINPPTLPPIPSGSRIRKRGSVL